MTIRFANRAILNQWRVSMATAGVEFKQPEAPPEETCSAKPSKQGEGLRQYYLQHIHELQLQVRQKTHNLNRLEAQRNELNSRGECHVLTLTLTLIPNSQSYYLCWRFVYFSDVLGLLFSIYEWYSLSWGRMFVTLVGKFS